MIRIRGVICFYQKIFVPAIVVSAAIAFIGLLWGSLHFTKTTGFAYLFISPLFHFFIYEIRNKNEYYFYYNLGLSRLNLWIFNIVISFIIGLTLIAL